MFVCTRIGMTPAWACGWELVQVRAIKLTMKKLSSSLVTEIGRRFIDNASPSEFKQETTPVWYNGEFIGNIEKPFLEFYVVNNSYNLKDHIELEIHTDEAGLIDKVNLIQEALA
jgi:hypothetical protein